MKKILKNQDEIDKTTQDDLETIQKAHDMIDMLQRREDEENQKADAQCITRTDGKSDIVRSALGKRKLSAANRDEDDKAGDAEKTQRRLTIPLRFPRVETYNRGNPSNAMTSPQKNARAEG